MLDLAIETHALRRIVEDLLAAQLPVLSWWALVAVASRASATLTITITGSNDGPTANTDEGGTVTEQGVTVAGVLNFGTMGIEDFFVNKNGGSFGARFSPGI